MLNGTKIKLRRVEKEDAFRLMLWENNVDHWKVSGTEIPFSLDEINLYIEQAQNFKASGQLRLMIDLINEEDTVGCVDLFDMNFRHKRAGVGILINNIEDRNKGYAKEALQLLENYVKNMFHFEQLFANIQEDNHTSILLFKQLGYVQAGAKKDWYIFGDQRVNELFFQKIIT